MGFSRDPNLIVSVALLISCSEGLTITGDKCPNWLLSKLVENEFHIVDGSVINVNGVLGIVEAEIPPNDVKLGEVNVKPLLCRLLLSSP